jgi:hypothetical protein
MKICTATLRSLAPYSQSRKHDAPKLDRERADDYEERTWREKCHYDADGTIFIPPMAFKMTIDEAAKFLGLQIPGKGKATFTKHFLSGALVMEGPRLPYKRDEVEGEWINANADGVRGSKRVRRCFPVIPSWEADVEFYILDPTITPAVFEEVLVAAGNFRGVGRFRPGNGGLYGRFEVVKTAWRNGA